MARRANKIAWSETPEANATYVQRRAEAQAKANETGFDYRLAFNELVKDYMISLLPMKKNRYGFELWCEVVSCEDLSKCRPGHGPMG